MIPIGETHDGRADMTNFEMDLFDTRMTGLRTEKDDEICCSSSRHRFIKPACFPITIVALIVIVLVCLPLISDDELIAPIKLIATSCEENCQFDLVESIPTGLNYTGGKVYNSTHLEWIKLIDNAERSIDIAALYWNLNSNEYPTAAAGRAVFEALIRAGTRGVKIRIAQDKADGLSNNTDSEFLASHGLAQVRTLNFTHLLGAGVLHTKFIIADIKNVYVGSANMDWKSLAEVKELGVVVGDCSCVAADLYKIFAVYWKLGEPDAKIPKSWPISFRTQFSAKQPMPIIINSGWSSLYISSSPELFNPKGREHDLSAILDIISRAEKSICISVMDFIPSTLYSHENEYWPVIDNALRDAAYRGIAVRLLISRWDHSRKQIDYYLKSMVDINPAIKGSIEVKRFVVPADEEQKKIPFARVNHNKYMVTDKTAYIGTSNWAGDYFINTAGVGVVVTPDEPTPDDIRSQLQGVFDRDWNSPYST